MAFAREEVDPEALNILIQAGYTWDPHLLGFRRMSANGHESATGDPAIIDYAFLREQRLLVQSSLGDNERDGQLQRLRILLQSLN